MKRVRATPILVAIDLDQTKAVSDDLRVPIGGFQSGKRDINQFDD